MNGTYSHQFPKARSYYLMHNNGPGHGFSHAPLVSVDLAQNEGPNGEIMVGCKLKCGDLITPTVAEIIPDEDGTDAPVRCVDGSQWGCGT